VEEELTGEAAGIESDFVNAAHEAGLDVGPEPNTSVDDSKVTPTVLVVDESLTVRMLVQMTLQGRGYNRSFPNRSSKKSKSTSANTRGLHNNGSNIATRIAIRNHSTRINFTGHDN
jgi:hypothetical protein